MNNSTLSRFLEYPFILFWGPPCSGKTKTYLDHFRSTHTRLSVTELLRNNTSVDIASEIIKLLNQNHQIVLEDEVLSTQSRNEIVDDIRDSGALGVDGKRACLVFEPISGAMQSVTQHEIHLAERRLIIDINPTETLPSPYLHLNNNRIQPEQLPILDTNDQEFIDKTYTYPFTELLHTRTNLATHSSPPTIETFDLVNTIKMPLVWTKINKLSPTKHTPDTNQLHTTVSLPFFETEELENLNAFGQIENVSLLSPRETEWLVIDSSLIIKWRRKYQEEPEELTTTYLEPGNKYRETSYLDYVKFSIDERVLAAISAWVRSGKLTRRVFLIVDQARHLDVVHDLLPDISPAKSITKELFRLYMADTFYRDANVPMFYYMKYENDISIQAQNHLIQQCDEHAYYPQLVWILRRHNLDPSKCFLMLDILAVKHVIEHVHFTISDAPFTESRTTYFSPKVLNMFQTSRVETSMIESREIISSQDEQTPYIPFLTYISKHVNNLNSINIKKLFEQEKSGMYTHGLLFCMNVSIRRLIPYLPSSTEQTPAPPPHKKTLIKTIAKCFESQEFVLNALDIQSNTELHENVKTWYSLSFSTDRVKSNECDYSISIPGIHLDGFQFLSNDATHSEDDDKFPLQIKLNGMFHTIDFETQSVSISLSGSISHRLLLAIQSNRDVENNRDITVLFERGTCDCSEYAQTPSLSKPRVCKHIIAVLFAFRRNASNNDSAHWNISQKPPSPKKTEIKQEIPRSAYPKNLHLSQQQPRRSKRILPSFAPEPKRSTPAKKKIKSEPSTPIKTETIIPQIRYIMDAQELYDACVTILQPTLQAHRTKALANTVQPRLDLRDTDEVMLDQVVNFMDRRENMGRMGSGSSSASIPDESPVKKRRKPFRMAEPKAKKVRSEKGKELERLFDEDEDILFGPGVGSKPVKPKVKAPVPDVAVVKPVKKAVTESKSFFEEMLNDDDDEEDEEEDDEMMVFSGFK